jgi:cytochrome oxidase Cu insertion factor (SCO1/SenC/PrrC family)
VRLRAIVGALLAVCAGAAFAQGAGTSTTSGLIGAVYTPPVPAADFVLIDQHGTPFHMADMAGKVVVFSFLYTHCEDVCPYIAMKLKAVHRLLGEQASRVGFVAVTTDPARDTPEVIARYSREAGLFDTWHFVTGREDKLRAVWSRYLANATATSPPQSSPSSGDEEEHGQGLGEADRGLARRLISGFGGGYEVAHFAAFHVIDARGRIRVTLDQDALPSEILANVKVLLDGK